MPNTNETRRGVVDNRHDQDQQHAEYERAINDYLVTAMPWTGIPMVPMGALPRLRIPFAPRRNRSPANDAA